MKTTLLRSQDRGHASHGWLDTYHSFSFGDYHDPKWMGYRTLRVLNDDLVMPGKGFGMHPHKDMEIISYVLSGALAHQDSMGNGSTIYAGDFQYMSAGSGVRHSEFNPSSEEATRLLQIWIIPDEKGAAPRYAERAMKNVASGEWHMVASKSGREKSMSIRQDADLMLARLEPGQSVSYILTPGRHAWLHVAEGEVTLNGSETLKEGDAVAVDTAGLLSVEASKTAQVLLFDLS